MSGSLSGRSLSGRSLSGRSLSRRSLGVAGVSAILSLGAGRVWSAEVLVEPSLRLPPSPDGARRVALTLDACPGGFDRRLAEALVEQRVPATIFVTALWMQWNPTGLAFLLAHRDIFTLENHGARHVPAVLGDAWVFGLRAAETLDAVRREVADGASAIHAATGVSSRWYRDATARYSRTAITMIEAMGIRIAGFSLNADMGASLPAGTVADRIVRARDGEVILGHINQPNRPSGAGIAGGVRGLRAAGVVFVGLG